MLSWIANLKYLGKAEFNFNIQKIISLLKKSLPYAGIIALMTIFTRIDSVMILKLLPHGRIEAGIYAMSYRLLDAASIIGILLAGQLLPLFSSNLVNKARLQSIIKWTTLLVLLPAIIATLVSSIQGNNIMEWLYPSKFKASDGIIFSIIIWSIPGMILVNIFGTLLTAAGKVKRINQLALVACAINIFGNMLFISNFGLKGVAITTVITQVFFGVMCYWEARRIY